MIPGEFLLADGPVAFNEGREITRLTVLAQRRRPARPGRSTTTSPRPIPVWTSTAPPRAASGSTSPPAPPCASSPGIPVDVELVPLTGARVVPGLRGETGGALDA